jgi:hypothetical protein
MSSFLLQPTGARAGLEYARAHTLRLRKTR